MLQQPHKLLFLILGHLSLVLGLIGAALPILPTTPLIILAAFFYSKASPKLHEWLRQLPHLGQHLRDWEDSGVIGLKAKITATIMILGIFLTTFYFRPMPIWLVIVLSLTGCGILLFLWTRPSKPEN